MTFKDKQKKKSWKKRLFNKAVLGISLFLGINFISISLVYFYNKNLQTEKKTAVFTSWSHYTQIEVPSESASRVIDFFMYAPVTLSENLRGNYVEWHSSASLDTFVEKIEDPYCNNFVLIGHGNKSSYELSDSSISSEDIENMNIRKKTGGFIQYTCGTGSEEDKCLEDALFEECTRVKKFDGILLPHVAYASAWRDVFVNEHK